MDRPETIPVPRTRAGFTGLHRLRAGILCLSVLTAAGICRSEGGYSLTTVAAGLDTPVRIAFAPDGSGRLFGLGLKTGDVEVIGGDSSQNGIWLHVDVSTQGERGLLGIAFDPDFVSNRFVYLYYTTGGPVVVNRVARYTEIAGRADTTTAMILYEAPVQTPCITTYYHNAGALTFGASGELYVSTGDNWCAEISAMADDPRGKILRIDPSSPAPCNGDPANVFFDDGDPSTGNDDRIFAKGLRNPFGLTFDMSDSTLFATENGPDCNDEINRVVNGADYGWRPGCNSGPDHCSCSQEIPYTPPLWAVTPTISPTGIVVYHGTAYPELDGNVIFTSYNDGAIRRGTFIDGGDSLDVEILFSPGAGSLLDVVRGTDGFLYVSGTDAIYRLDPLPTEIRETVTKSVGDRISAVHRSGHESRFRVRYTLTGEGEVRLALYDLLGRLVGHLASGHHHPGIHETFFSHEQIASGVYILRLSTPRTVSHKTLTVIR